MRVRNLRYSVYLLFSTDYWDEVCCFFRGTAVGVANVQGEDQKKLDVLANDLFINMLKSSFEVSDCWNNCMHNSFKDGIGVFC